MPTKTIDKSAKIKLIPNTSRYSIGHTCPKCGCDGWFKANPATQKRVAAGKEIYGCGVCKSGKAADWQKANADKEKARKAEYYQANADRVKAQRAEYYQANPHVARTYVAKRRATKLNSTPHWLTKRDLAKIKGVYKDCPSGYQVDHILPLQGKRICGLHVTSNLKAIPASENMGKGNREPDWTKKWQPGLCP